MAKGDDNQTHDLRQLISPRALARYLLDNADYADHLSRTIRDNKALQKKIAESLEQAAADPDTRDYSVLTIVAANYLRQGETMPEWLRVFAADALTGKITPRARRGRKKTGVARDFTLWAAVEVVSDIFGMPKYSHGNNVPHETAVGVVADVAGESINVVLHALRNYADYVPPSWGR